MTSSLFGDRRADIPSAVADRAEEMYGKTICAPALPGDSDFVGGFWIETHTIGCRNHGDDPEQEWWSAHWAIYDGYAADGISVIGGDPSDGAFVTITRAKEETVEPLPGIAKK